MSLFGSMTLQAKDLVPDTPKISVCTSMVSQGRPEGSAEQSQGLRQRNTGDDVRWELEGTNYQVSAAFVDYTEPEWERPSAFRRAWFAGVMEIESWLGRNVQLCAKFCPLLLPLKLEFSNRSMFFACTVSINCCRGQAGHSQAMEQWRRSKAVVIGEPDYKCKRNPPRTFCS